MEMVRRIVSLSADVRLITHCHCYDKELGRAGLLEIAPRPS